MKKIEFGTGQVYFIEINQKTGESFVSTKSFTDVSGNKINFTTREIIVDTSDFQINDNVIIGILNENKYIYGKVSALNRIKIDTESEIDILYNKDCLLNIFKGVSAGIFKGVTLSISSSGVGYSGQYMIDKELGFPDVSLKLIIDEVILNQQATSFILGLSSVGSLNGMAFVNNIYRKKNKPKDLAVLIIKNKTENNSMQEELYCHRVSSSTLSIPFAKNKFSTKNYTMELMRKSVGSIEVVDYIVDTNDIDISDYYLLWEDGQEFIWEDEENFVTDYNLFS